MREIKKRKEVTKKHQTLTNFGVFGKTNLGKETLYGHKHATGPQRTIKV